MNHKFFKLPLEKQQRIINAAYKVFSQSSYKKAPMSEIAEESGISKALLFHYFGNKKGLYLYLWTNAIEMTRKAVREYRTLKTNDFFEMLKRSLLSKCFLMRDYPHMYAFSLRAYYETDPEIKSAIQENFSDVSKASEKIVFEKMKDMKRSLDLLGKNACCQTMILPKAGHDFPMRNSRKFNIVLNDFLSGKIKED